jgi:hypothetical protein
VYNTPLTSARKPLDSNQITFGLLLGQSYIAVLLIVCKYTNRLGRWLRMIWIASGLEPGGHCLLSFSWSVFNQLLCGCDLLDICWCNCSVVYTIVLGRRGPDLYSNQLLYRCDLLDIYWCTCFIAVDIIVLGKKWRIVKCLRVKPLACCRLPPRRV